MKRKCNVCGSLTGVFTVMSYKVNNNVPIFIHVCGKCEKNKWIKAYKERDSI